MIKCTCKGEICKDQVTIPYCTECGANYCPDCLRDSGKLEELELRVTVDVCSECGHSDNLYTIVCRVCKFTV